MKLIYNRFSIIPHTCGKCEKAFWLEPYKRYKVERFSMFGTVEYVTNICKKCVISELKGEDEEEAIMTDKEKIKNLLSELVDMIDNGSQRDLDRADEIAKYIVEAFDKHISEPKGETE